MTIKRVRVSTNKDAQVEYIPERVIRYNQRMEDELNQVLSDNQDEIAKAIEDILIFGTGAVIIK